MIGPALLMLAAIGASPALDETRTAVLADIYSTAMLGGGNAAASWDWVVGKDGTARPRLEIERLNCTQRGRGAKCDFILMRAPAANASSEDQALVRSLSCNALFEAFDDGDGKMAWHVVRHIPPHNRGPALTTMVCSALS